MLASAGFGLSLLAVLLIAGVPIYISLIGVAVLLTLLQGAPTRVNGVGTQDQIVGMLNR